MAETKAQETLAITVSQATGLSPTQIRRSLRPPLSIQSNRLYDVWAGDGHLILKEPEADILLHPNQEDLMEEDEWRDFAEPYTTGCLRTDPGMAQRAQQYALLLHAFWLVALIRSGLERVKRSLAWLAGPRYGRKPAPASLPGEGSCLASERLWRST